MDSNYIIRKLKEQGKKQIELSRFMGLDATAINKIIKGKRSISANEADQIRQFFGDEGYTPPPSGGRLMRTQGFVQAGVWQEANELAYEDQKEHLVELDHPLADKMYLLEVRGDSMNKADMEDGSTIICLPVDIFTEKWRDLKTGDYVVVYRNDHGSFEATVKELEIKSDGSYWLWPRSNNPEFLQPIKIPPLSEVPHSLDHIDGHEIVVSAIVLGRTRPQMFVQ